MSNPGYYPAGGNPVETDPQARTMGMLCHLSPLSGLIVPFGSILGPLVLWLMLKDKIPFVRDQGKEALNFNICYFLYIIVSALLVFLLIGFVLLPAVVIAWLVLLILAAVKANSGEAYRYPLIFRIIP